MNQILKTIRYQNLTEFKTTYVLSNLNTYECFLNLVSQHAYDTCKYRTHVLDYVLTAWTVKRLVLLR